MSNVFFIVHCVLQAGAWSMTNRNEFRVVWNDDASG
jgi:hypothetical protein